MTLPRLQANTIFFDIDETIATTVPDQTDATFLGTLIRLVAAANHLDATKAEARIRATFDPEKETVDAHYKTLGITERMFWDALMEWFPKQIVGFPDAVAAIKVLHARGFRLFTGTTNSSLGCRLKLHCLGLADFNGSPYFTSMLGGAEVHPKGKSTFEFFVRLLKMADANPDEVVHVGDSPQYDLALARQAGIRQVVLPRRMQAQEWVWEDDGGLYVRSLVLLPRLVAKIDKPQRFDYGAGAKLRATNDH